MKPLPVNDEPKVDWEKYHALWAEIKFRQKVIRRLYPEAGFRYGHAGFSWDRTGPAVVMVLLNGRESTNEQVFVDEEMTLLMRAIDIVQEPSVAPTRKKVAEGLSGGAVDSMNKLVDALVYAACSDEDWARDDVQDAWANLMGREPLDRMVSAVSEED